MNKIKNIIYALALAFIIVTTLDVNALTQGTIKGTTDPDSYIVTDKATLTINKSQVQTHFLFIKLLMFSITRQPML